MKKIFLWGALILVLLTAACGANRGAAPTLVGTMLPDNPANTPFGGFGTGTVVVTSTASILETPTPGVTQSIATQVPLIGSPSAGTSQAAGIPVTGLDIVPVDCQFCVGTIAHALLVLPDTATFEIVSESTTTTTGNTTTTFNTNCSTIEVNNGKQVVLCSGPEKTAIALNVCVTSNNTNACKNVPVDLLPCRLTEPVAPASNVPTKTPRASGGSGAGGATSYP